MLYFDNKEAHKGRHIQKRRIVHLSEIILSGLLVS